ncbi:hypothetical protein Q8A67_020429 [Cirrhinus molitorella]|uniref:PH domain-containing protein n=1 Tax=Cirrhinus molitorella TaxID=172907 RepID=A0AA88TCU6_9TELE|nr:hypothetical protein Q8A67_020429 [Cirrhinus molitorella]
MSSKKKPKATEESDNEPVMVEELYTGYLLKSPLQPAMNKNTKLWKRCFFVLSKTSEDSYQLIYHINNERRDKPLGEIDLSKISLLFVGPETHQKRDWIQENFKFSPFSVLFLRVEEEVTPKNSRDYFLIGENRESVNVTSEDSLLECVTEAFNDVSQKDKVKIKGILSSQSVEAVPLLSWTTGDFNNFKPYSD